MRGRLRVDFGGVIGFRSFLEEGRSQRVRIGTQDLRIASIAIAHGGTVLTRNRKDFEQVPGLIIEDWSF